MPVHMDQCIQRQGIAALPTTYATNLQHVQNPLPLKVPISTTIIIRRLVASGLHLCRPLIRLPTVYGMTFAMVVGLERHELQNGSGSCS
ncbi:hypothetical protein TNCV_3733781 [Trichonephila clavipes]|nr:hypothetical protein TNCV_3733781 [Trichonephila clavipes]